MSAEPTTDGLAITVAETAEALARRTAGERLHPVDAYLLSLGSDNSRAACKNALKRILRILGRSGDSWRTEPWWTMTHGQALAIRHRLIVRFKPAGARVTLDMLRGVLKQAWIGGFLTGDEYTRLTAWPPIRGVTAPTGRMLDDGEVRALHAAAARRGAFIGALDAGILGCTLGGGMRCIEVIGLDVESLSDDGKHMLVRGKGSKERVQPLPAWAGGAVETWLAQRARIELTTKALFPPIKHGKIADERLTRWQLWARLRDLGAAAGVVFTPHDLRRTYASKLLDANVHLATAQRLMGHADPRTTSGYDRRGERAKDDAVSALDVWGAPAKA